MRFLLCGRGAHAVHDPVELPLASPSASRAGGEASRVEVPDTPNARTAGAPARAFRGHGGGPPSPVGALEFAAVSPTGEQGTRWPRTDSSALLRDVSFSAQLKHQAAQQPQQLSDEAPLSAVAGFALPPVKVRARECQQCTQQFDSAEHVCVPAYHESTRAPALAYAHARLLTPVRAPLMHITPIAVSPAGPGFGAADARSTSANRRQQPVERCLRLAWRCGCREGRGGGQPADIPTKPVPIAPRGATAAKEAAGAEEAGPVGHKCRGRPEAPLPDGPQALLWDSSSCPAGR